MTVHGLKDRSVSKVAADNMSAGTAQSLSAKEGQGDDTQRTPRRVKTFDELLVRLKEEYIDILNKSVSFATDEFGVTHGFFSSVDNTRLYLPEAKLRIIALEASDDTINEWIVSSRAAVLKRVTPGAPQMAAAYNAMLNKLCVQFEHSLSDDIVFYQYQGKMIPSISDANKKKLHELARQIVEVGKLLAQDRYQWLLKTWTDFERSHQVIH